MYIVHVYKKIESSYIDKIGDERKAEGEVDMTIAKVHENVLTQHFKTNSVETSLPHSKHCANDE